MADPGFPVGGGGADPLGGGANLQRIHFSVKTYAKTKEIDPVGRWRVPQHPPPDLPMALDVSRIRPFDRVAADLSPRSSCIWFQPRLTVEAAHWLINYTLSFRDYFYYYI